MPFVLQILIRKSRAMKMCCQQTVIATDDIFLYKGQNKQRRQKILTRQSQVNPLLSHSEQRILMFAKSNNELTIETGGKRKLPFKDVQFPPNPQSLGRYEGRKIQWVRLSQIVQTGAQSQYIPMDILSLKEGDTYFLASIAALSEIPAIIDQAFDQELKLSSLGAYKLNLNIKGKPQQIIIDDYLPVFADNHRRAAFCHIESSNFWVALFEKAYAKIQGNYQNISFGYAHQVLVTFSMSPCIYKLIPTDFRHQQQQKCWNILMQSLQMRYPTVVGSRKRFTCNAIIPHQSYCLKTCKTVKHAKGQERRVFLWNILGMQAVQSKGVEYEKNGGVINISLVEFMRNFEVLDISHVRPNFSSYFYEFKSGPKQSALYAFTTNEKASVYLTLQRKQGEKGRLRIILIHCTNEATYQLFSGKKQEIYNDVTLHSQKLPMGSYVVICQSQSDSSCLLRIYAQKPIPLLKFAGKKDVLLERTFMQMAFNLHSEQFALAKQHNDWYLPKVLFDDLGLGFFALHLDYNSLLKCQISVDKRQLAEEGLSLINKSAKDGYAVVVEQGQSDILIFEYIGKSNQVVCFPPSSLRIRVVI